MISVASCRKAGPGGVDLSRFPSSLNEWTGQDFIDYFALAGVFATGKGYAVWVESHEKNWPKTPVAECAGWRSTEDGGVGMILVYRFSGEFGDTSPEECADVLAYIRESKALPLTMTGVPVTHLAGNVGVSVAYTRDKEVRGKAEAAWAELIEKLGAAPEF